MTIRKFLVIRYVNNFESCINTLGHLSDNLDDDWIKIIFTRLETLSGQEFSML